MRLAPSNSSWVKNTTGEWLRREKESSVTPRGDPSGTEPLGPVRPVERGPKLLGGDKPSTSTIKSGRGAPRPSYLPFVEKS